MRLGLSKIFQVIIYTGIILSLGFNHSYVNATDNLPPTITLIDRNTDNSFSITSQEIGIARTQKVNLNEVAFEKIARELFADQKSIQPARLQIFPDLSVDVSFEKIDHTLQSGYILSGILNNDLDSSILMVSSEGLVSANLEFQGKQYQLRENGQGFYQFEEVDQAQFPDDLEQLPENSDPLEGIFDQNHAIASLDSSYVIDVLVVYTAAARSGAGGTTNMQNLINLAVSETNLGYQRSGVFSSMRLVHTAEINYDEAVLSNSSGWSTALSHLTARDNIIDEVHNLRDSYGADLVVMIVNNMTYCGIGWLMTPTYTNDSVGFSMVSRACATGYYSFAHETGHNMGAHHDRLNTDGGTAMFNYSYGYHDPNASFRTIMAYDCPSSCPRINNWSNPEVIYNGKPTGVSSSAINSADNRMTLNNTAAIVSNFRASKIAPVAPTNLVIQNIKSNGILVGFVDNSMDEQGFKVERSFDGKNWSPLLSLSANTTSFEDQRPVCGGQFFYRVYAYNQNGNSTFSNIASTGVINCNPPDPITDIKIFSSISSITLDWISNDSDIKYLIQIQEEANRPLVLDTGFEINQLPVTLSGLERGTTYIITITATNDFGVTVNDPVIVDTMSEVVYLPLTVR